MDKKNLEYGEGYRTGAASTQDQARGARDADLDRQTKAREERDRYDAIRRQEEERQRREQRDREADSRRRAEEQEADRRQKAAASSSAGDKGSQTSGAKIFVGFVGLVAGAALGFEAAPDNWIVICLFAAVAASLAAALYKFIIGLVVAMVVLWLWAQSEARPLDSRSATGKPTSHLCGRLSPPACDRRQVLS